MGKVQGTFGLVGCGQLGGAIGRALIRAEAVDPARLWIFNRSGPGGALAACPGINWTTDLQRLAERCDTILLALPPTAGRPLRFDAAGRLVVSVMAGVTVEELRAISGSHRVVRAMSSPAAEIGMAYSPFFAAPAVPAGDKAAVRALFATFGTTDEVPEEGQIDGFTAVTGPVPGFVAYFAECMQRYCEQQGVAPDVARRAIAQLFAAAGQMLVSTDRPAAEFVQEMVDYAGTTAAGLEVMRASNLADVIAGGLEAARQRCLTIGRED